MKDTVFENKVIQLKNQGFSIIDDVYAAHELTEMENAIQRYFLNITESAETVYAIRDLLHSIPQLRNVIFNQNLLTIVKNIDQKAFLTKAIFFDKGETNNWYVTPHQDLAISVKRDASVLIDNWKKITEGYYGWTEKKETTSVCPPEEISKNRFTIRIHIDEANVKNGALKVIPKTQGQVYNDTEIQQIVENNAPVVCEVKAGGIQLMKPLLIHSSAKSVVPKKRRVIHLEFASLYLKQGLLWGERINLNKYLIG